MKVREEGCGLLLLQAAPSGSCVSQIQLSKIGEGVKTVRLLLGINMQFALWFCLYLSTPVDVNNKEMMLKIIKSAINTKAINRWSDLACSIALDAVKTVEFEENGRKEIDIKKYAKVEKVSLS